MRKSRSKYAKRSDRETPRCGCEVPDPDAADDVELEHLFRELALTHFRLMDPEDADILIRTEFRNQTISEIATQIGCSRVEANRRLHHAQRCFCRLLVLTLAPAKSK